MMFQTSSSSSKSALLTIIFICWVGFCWKPTLITRALAQSAPGSSPSSNEPENEEWIDLFDLTDVELEAICTDRGFELVRETLTHDEIVYTHQDYVEAAQQCLAIEAEMEKVLQENPDILQQLQEETERMEAEKQKLEEELARVTHQLKQQQQQDVDSEEATPAFICANNINATALEEQQLPQRIQQDTNFNNETKPEPTQKNETTETTIESEVKSQSSAQGLQDETQVQGTSTTQNSIDANLSDRSILRESLNQMKQQLIAIISIAAQSGISVANMMIKYLRAILVKDSMLEEQERVDEAINVDGVSVES